MNLHWIVQWQDITRTHSLVWAYSRLNINWSFQLWIVFVAFRVFLSRAVIKGVDSCCAFHAAALSTPRWLPSSWIGRIGRSGSRSRSIFILRPISKAFVAEQNVIWITICDRILIKLFDHLNFALTVPLTVPPWVYLAQTFHSACRGKLWNMLNYLKNLFLTSLSLFSTAAGDLISTSNWPNEKWLINLNIRYGEHSISAWSELNIEMMKFRFNQSKIKVGFNFTPFVRIWPL